MNEALKVKNIEEHFNKIGKKISNNFVYGYENASTRSLFFLGALSAFNLKSYIIAFYPEEITLAALTMTGKFKDSYINIKEEEIESIKIKKGLIQYKVIIKTLDEKFKLNFNKTIFKNPWQKENIRHMEDNNWYNLSDIYK